MEGRKEGWRVKYERRVKEGRKEGRKKGRKVATHRTKTRRRSSL
jgi:hypothetical protein